MTLENHQIADIFDEMADLLELKQENPFRVRAYRNGARAIRGLGESVVEWVNDPERDLADVPGIGQTLVAKTRALVENGSLPQLEELRSAYPPGVLAMVRIPGVGAKKAAALHRELHVETLEDLKRACEQGKVAELKGFGKKTQQTILDGLSIAEQADDRIYWAEADEIAERLRDHFRQSSDVDQIELAGSYRRGRETIGDLDVLVVSAHPKRVMDHFEAFPLRRETLLRGSAKKMSIRLTTGLQVDLRIVAPHQFGAALQYFTGSQAHNVRLRNIAKQKGLKLNEYGLFPSDADVAADPPVASETEQEIYEALGLPWIDPALREDRFEFQWAAEGSLPQLVALKNIRGDLHMHTNATDGRATIREMADAALQRGLKYIAITDHSKRVAMAGGLDEERLLAQWETIDEIRGEYEGRLTILKGIECDILENGRMDLRDECLAQGDWIIASIHYGQKQPRAQITDRILQAIHNPHVDAIAHPTGRLINRRPPYEVDMEAVIQAAAETGTMLELNANPARLDLNDVHLSMAREYHVPVVINTDAHSPEGLDVMRYGILQARRGGLAPSDVANTRPVKSFLKLRK